MYIENINSPADVKKLSVEQMNILAAEIRSALLEKLSDHGGHVGPNLGMVEAIIAMHYVFNSPVDKFVFDVSHQSYVHKILTGRKEAFLNQKDYDDVTGYTNPDESDHDFFMIGHTSTSVSLACGLVKGRDLKGDKEKIVAVIGDGSLSGGEAYEGLSNAGEAGTQMIIVVNDNEMSIADNHGGLYENLRRLRETKGNDSCNFFKSLNLEYLYVEEGNNISTLIDAFQKAKTYETPIVVHIHTEKGHGYRPAVDDKEKFHYRMPFDLATGDLKTDYSAYPDYGMMTGEYLLNKMKSDPTVVAISSGTPSIIGFNREKRKIAGKQFVDVGIAEEHAVALSSGIAKNGGKPVYCVFSTFIQRCYDQLSQDLCLNRNPAVILTFAASVYGMTDATHLGIFDIPMMSNIPNLVYLAPTCKEEYFAMLDWAIEQNEYPVAIRVPGGDVISESRNFNTDYSDINKYELVKRGENVAVIGLGSFFELGKEIVTDLIDKGIDATLINPRYITGVDCEMLEQLKDNHQVVITLEDGELDGGFGEKIARYYGDSSMRVLNFGLRKAFTDRIGAEELLKSNRLTVPQIVADISDVLNGLN